MALPDTDAYARLVYSLPEQFPAIQRSTLVLATIGATLAKVEGQISFPAGIVLDVWELLDFEARRILNYSYEIYRAGDKTAWYDPFEHPHLVELASTYPHHKHLAPDIKHNRLPAPGIGFEQANLPFLIQEIEHTLLPAT